MADKDIYSYATEDAPTALSRMLMAKGMAETTWGPEIIVDATTNRLSFGGVEMGDTGRRTVTGGILRRCGNVIQHTGTDPLPAGFSNTDSATGDVFITNDAWPVSLPGTAA